MRCDRFDDLVASNALMRPGPLDAGMHKVYIRRKRGEEPVVVRAPRARADPRADVRRHHLSGTGDAHRAGARGHLARRSRRAAKGGGQEGRGADQEGARQVRREGRRARLRPAIIEELAGQIETFGRYGFNKSHSVAYSVISYHTAWLKAHYPAEFMAALLSSPIGDTDSVVKYINEARELGTRGAAARRERVGLQVHGRRRQAHPLRARRHPQRRHAARSIRSSPRARDGPFKSLFDLCRARRPAALQQARVRGADPRRARSTRSAGIARSTSRCSTRRSRKRRSSRRSARRARSRCSATSGDERRRRATRAAQPTLPNVAAMDRVRAAHARRRRSSASTSPGIRSSRSAPSASCSPRTRSSQLGHVDAGADDARRRRHGDQAADQQAIGRRVRAVDSRGFFRIFRGAGVSRRPGRRCRDRIRTDVPLLHQGRLLAARSGRRESDVHRRVGHALRRELRASGRWRSRSSWQRLGRRDLDAVDVDARTCGRWSRRIPGSAPLELRWSDGNG